MAHFTYLCAFADMQSRICNQNSVHVLFRVQSSEYLRFSSVVCAAAMLAILVNLDHTTDSELEEEYAAVSLVSRFLET